MTTPKNTKRTTKTKIETEWNPADHEQSTLRNKRTTKTKKDSGYMELAEGIMNGTPPANLRRPSEVVKPAPRNVRTPEKFISDLLVVLHQKIASLAIERASAEAYKDVIALLRCMEHVRDRQQASGKLYFMIVNDIQYRPYVEQVLALAGSNRESLTEDFNALAHIVR